MINFFYIVYGIFIYLIVNKYYCKKTLEKMTDLNSVENIVKSQYQTDYSNFVNLSEKISYFLGRSDKKFKVKDLDVKVNFNHLPAFSIVPFYSAEIPEGWILCDGKQKYKDENGKEFTSPDLTDRFIMSDSTAYGSKMNKDYSRKVDKNHYNFSHEHGRLNNTAGGHQHSRTRDYVFANSFPKLVGNTKKSNAKDAHFAAFNDYGIGHGIMGDRSFSWNELNYRKTTSSSSGGHEHHSDQRGKKSKSNIIRIYPPYYKLVYIMKVPSFKIEKTPKAS